MKTNDEKFNSILDIVDVTNERAFRFAMSDLSLELVKSMDEGKIETDNETMAVIQGIVLLSLASNVHVHTMDAASATIH